ncbi:MAG: PSD1 and planctomycete cytochrome C domain-containing protein [Chthoniobacter sp.]|nr:PSD1 and planctomycete cytochrome C domain-containing protein [Chthoniobacter sp.]
MPYAFESVVHRSLVAALLSLSGGSMILAADSAGTPALDFNRDVRPILSDNCFKCHGFDPATRKADRRLDTREGALEELDGVRAIVPGNLRQSDFSTRIHSTEKDEQMPPPKSGKKLTPAQIATLDKWIEQGAPYAAHWAFVKPVQAPVPALRNPIDAFIRARLEKEKLQPSPEADKYTLIRRVSLDLTGLPPTPEEVAAFIADCAGEGTEGGKEGKSDGGTEGAVSPSLSKTDQAYERVVDRLLASPHYGERWARRWLDLARYSDTNGYEKDRERSIWPYRDWVINAFNADMPFDQFTVGQIAGDLLPNATRDQLVATGFHRNTMLNEEGGIDPLEFRYLAMVDRVTTTGATWLGLTVQCAQCHTHKYDPITHREYFELMASMDNADEPELDLPAPDAAAQEKARAEKLAKLIGELPGKFPVPPAAAKAPKADGETAAEVERPIEERRRELVETKFAEWLARERERSVRWETLRPVSAKSNLPALTVQEDSSVFVSGDMSKSDTYEVVCRSELPGITAVRLEVLADDRLPRHGPGRVFYEGEQGDFFLSEFTLFASGEKRSFGKATASFGKGIGAAIDGDQQSGWMIEGGEGRDHEAVFNLAQPLASGGEFTIKMLFERYYSAGLGKFRISVTNSQRTAEARALPGDIAALLLLPDAEITAAQRERLRAQFLLSAPELAAARKEIDELRKPLRHTTTLVMRERPPENPRPTFLHHRGEWLEPKERVQPGVIAVGGPLPADAPRNRLGLARWLVSRENPLTARVIMNRDWAALFGRGIVRTTGDFGFQGDAPTHPELLDWLAVEFMQRGWSLKQMHKLMVMSATYRQSSAATPERFASDPDNHLLARGPRFRLEAEIVRDAALRASGLLSEKIGGPSVRPPQPAGVTEVAYGSQKWDASSGPDRYRRSLYTFAKRSAPFALYNTFDAPTGEACIVRRDVSNTPLQALSLLNDVVFLEAAQALGKTLAAQGGSTEDRIRTAFRRIFTRPPTADETATLAQFFAAQQARFAASEPEAKKLAPEGPGPAADRAAWTALARTLFNLDEAVTRS